MSWRRFFGGKSYLLAAKGCPVCRLVILRSHLYHWDIRIGGTVITQ